MHRFQRIVLMSSLFATGLLVGWLGFVFQNHFGSKRKSDVLILQTLSERDSGASFKVMAKYTLTRKPVGDIEHFSMSDISIVIDRFGLEMGEVGRVFAYEYPGQLNCIVSTPPPLWDGQYIPHESFILPTGRLAYGSTG